MTCHGIKGAFQHPDVRIGWYPFRANRVLEVRTKPNGGQLIKTVPKYGGLALQSTRNPESEPLDPRQRIPILMPDGEIYSWVYTRTGTLQGWVNKAMIEVDPDAANKTPLLGPAKRDFEVGRTLPLPKMKSGCGNVSKTQPLRRVKVRETYLRYSPRGTAFHYLHEDDIVRLLIVDGGHGFGFCEVISLTTGSAAKIGSRGWIQHVSLGPING